METSINTKPRLAFTGVGWIGRNRLQAAANSNLATIAVITDPSQACVEEAIKIAPQSKATASFKDAITEENIDGVVIATPSALHKEQAVAAFEQDKAVFCQKPLGRNLEEVTAVVNAAKKSNKLLGADFSYRYTKAFQAIYSIIQSGELGKIFGVDLKFHNAYGPDKPWFYDLNLSGGGCVLDLGIHLIDLMLYALNFPNVTTVSSDLFAKGNSVKGKQAVEDYANVFMSLDNDVTAQLACSWNLAAGCEAVIEASFYGTNGGVALKNVNGSFYDFVGLRYWGTKTETIIAPPDDWGGKALINWIEKLAADGSYNSEAEDFLKSAAVLDKIYGRIA
ncbi:Gfo/Idh/MocA family oxidoreductase [Ilyomonas limi]|uniref:Gfo/Idh/MocA family oxidoreductase n=1 Tax=Ilyomonas limi TaxID=2575867 RepID=A0A4U3L922_9BACT|nr:Gfo/Idh/MocA family oxidoreductase [Ilyomonas limi]TKK71821.1 Gfo/Idh/MocA family oxidoreductase [Ilyomonas limi]